MTPTGEAQAQMRKCWARKCYHAAPAVCIREFEAAVRQQIRDEYAPAVAALMSVNDVIELIECGSPDCSTEEPCCVGRVVSNALAALRAGEEGGR